MKIKHYDTTQRERQRRRVLALTKVSNELGFSSHYQMLTDMMHAWEQDELSLWLRNKSTLTMPPKG